MRFTRGDVRDPYRFIPNRSRISVVALKSDAAAEKPKDQLSRDFLGCSIFDFCNNIGTFRTWRDVRPESDFGAVRSAYDPQRTWPSLGRHAGFSRRALRVLCLLCCENSAKFRMISV